MHDAATNMVELVSNDIGGVEFFRALIVQQYIGWPEIATLPSVNELHQALSGQTFGKVADKERFKIWALVEHIQVRCIGLVVLLTLYSVCTLRFRALCPLVPR